MSVTSALAIHSSLAYSLRMKIQIDAELCTGCEDCSEACPSLFRMGSDWIAEPTVDVVPADLEGEAVKTAELCQFEAIRIETE